ncbi:hypothetical protein ScPMuIL_012126 [Solemya velum]
MGNSGHHGPTHPELMYTRFAALHMMANRTDSIQTTEVKQTPQPTTAATTLDKTTSADVELNTTTIESTSVTSVTSISTGKPTSALGAGEIAAITVGVLLVLGILVTIIVLRRRRFCCFRRKRPDNHAVISSLPSKEKLNAIETGRQRLSSKLFGRYDRKSKEPKPKQSNTKKNKQNTVPEIPDRTLKTDHEYLDLEGDNRKVYSVPGTNDMTYYVSNDTDETVPTDENASPNAEVSQSEYYNDTDSKKEGDENLSRNAGVSQSVYYNDTDSKEEGKMTDDNNYENVKNEKTDVKKPVLPKQISQEDYYEYVANVPGNKGYENVNGRKGKEAWQVSKN